MTAVTPDQGIHHDPTALKSTEEEIKASYQALQMILAQLPGVIQQAVVTAIMSALGFTPAQIAELLAVVQGAEAFLTNPVTWIDQHVLNPTSPVAPVQKLGQSLQGLLPPALDNSDGTAKVIGSQIVINADGTATLIEQAGSTAVNAVVDAADGTVQSVAASIKNLHGVSGTSTYALQNWKDALTTAGVESANHLAQSLGGIIPAALDNFDGTAKATISGAQQIIINGDGTATYIAQQSDVLAQQGFGIVHGLIDAGDGIAMSFSQGMSQGFHALRSGLFSAFTGTPVIPQPNSSPPVAQISAAAAALQQRLAIIGNGAEEQVDIEFSAYGNGAVPGIFTAKKSTGTAPVISGGELVESSPSSNYIYVDNTTELLTDYHQISGAWPVMSGSFPAAGLIGRWGPGINAGVYVSADYGYSTTGVWTISNYNGQFEVQFSDTFTPGAVYTLLCGDPSTNNLYKYQLLKSGQPLPISNILFGDTSQPVGQLYYIDTNQFSAVGGSNRSAGLIISVGGGGGSVAMSNFKFQDTTKSSPSVLVATSESTGSTAYTDLTTTSDEVAVKIGDTGIALVFIAAEVSYVGGSGGNPIMSFAMSGANTQAASDMYSAGSTAYGLTPTISACFMLTDLSPGLTLFKLKYRVSGATWAYLNRRIGVVAL